MKGVSGLSAVLSALASPTTLAVVAIGAVVAAIGLLIYNSEEARKFVSDAFEKIKEAAEPLCENIADLFGTISEVILFLWNEILKPLAQWIIATIIPIIVPIIKTLGAVFTDIFVGIIGVINSVIQILSGLIDFIIGIFTNDWERAWEGVKAYSPESGTE